MKPAVTVVMLSDSFEELWTPLVEDLGGDLRTVEAEQARIVTQGCAAVILAHNLVWTLMHEAAEATDAPVDRISFSSTVKTVLNFSSRLMHAGPRKRVTLYQAMLQRIGGQRNPYRPNRIEPRLVKRDRTRYAFLKIPREEARKRA